MGVNERIDRSLPARVKFSKVRFMPYLFPDESLFIWGVSVLIVVILVFRWFAIRKREHLAEEDHSTEDN